MTIASRYEIAEGKIGERVLRNKKLEIEEVAHLITLEDGFREHGMNAVQKKCRPFVGKKEYFNAKFREILRESESKMEPNFNVFLSSLLSKEKHRLTKAVIPKMQ